MIVMYCLGSGEELLELSFKSINPEFNPRDKTARATKIKTKNRCIATGITITPVKCVSDAQFIFL